MHDHFLIRHKFPKSLEMFRCRGRMSHFDLWVAQRCCLPGPKTSDQNLLKKIGSYWQWRTPENSTTRKRKVRWGRSRFSNLLPSTLSETPASSLQPIGCRDYPNISNQQPADSRFRRVSKPPRAGSNKHEARVTFWKGRKRWSPGLFGDVFCCFIVESVGVATGIDINKHKKYKKVPLDIT